MEGTHSQDSRSAPTMVRWIPAAQWLRSYDRRLFRSDAVAGLTLAAYLLPSAIGDSSLAQLPPEAGLYSCLFAGLVFWLFCSSRHTTIAVTSAISLLLGSTLGGLAGGDATRFGALASATALLVAAIAFVAWLLIAGDELPFGVGHRQVHPLDALKEDALGPGRSQFHPATEEPAGVVPRQRGRRLAGFVVEQQAALHKNLKPVADAEDQFSRRLELA